MGLRKDSTMRSNSDGNGNGRIEAILKRQAALRAVLAQERVKEQQRREREYARLCALVGAICVRNGEESPEFRAMLIRTMQGADITEGDRTFLVQMNWL
jgi:hypothetical protein